MKDSPSTDAVPLHDQPAADPLDTPQHAAEKTTLPEYNLVLAGAAVFAVSLALPTTKGHDLPGWKALLWTAAFAMKEPFSTFTVLTLGNLCLVLSPLVARSRNGRLLSVAAVASWLSVGGAAFICFLANISRRSLSEILDLYADLRIGYYVWVTSFFLSAIGMTLLARRRRDNVHSPADGRPRTHDA